MSYSSVLQQCPTAVSYSGHVVVCGGMGIKLPLGHAKLICCCSGGGGPGGKVGQVGRQNKTKKNMNIIKKPNKFGISCLKIGVP